MKSLMLSGLISVVCFGGEPVLSDYSVLVISSEVITANGHIDLNQWEKWAFHGPAHVSIGKGVERKEYLPVGDLFFSLIGPVGRPNAVNEDLAQRFARAGVNKDLSIAHGRVCYQGRKLKYPGRVIHGPAMWGSSILGDVPHGFRFREYLIFMVQVRPFSTEDSFDFVLYNLKEDTYAVHRTFGGWPKVWMFRQDEAIPDPRLKTETP